MISVSKPYVVGSKAGIGFRVLASPRRVVGGGDGVSYEGISMEAPRMNFALVRASLTGSTKPKRSLDQLRDSDMSEKICSYCNHDLCCPFGRPCEQREGIPFGSLVVHDA